MKNNFFCDKISFTLIGCLMISRTFLANNYRGRYLTRIMSSAKETVTVKLNTTSSLGLRHLSLLHSILQRCITFIGVQCLCLLVCHTVCQDSDCHLRCETFKFSSTFSVKIVISEGQLLLCWDLHRRRFRM